MKCPLALTLLLALPLAACEDRKPPDGRQALQEKAMDLRKDMQQYVEKDAPVAPAAKPNPTPAPEPAKAPPTPPAKPTSPAPTAPPEKP